MIINKTLLAKYSPLPVNYNYDEIFNYVPIAQEIWIRPLIGDDLLDELEEQVENDSISPENATLMTDGFLLQYLAYATCYEGLAFIYANFSEVGITTARTDASESISLKSLTYIESHLRRQVEFLKDSVKKWLCEHSESFPLADVCACGCGACEGKGKLNSPNKLYQLYSPRRVNTSIR